MDVTTIYDQLIREHPLSLVTVGQIYYWWNIALQEQYRLDDNEFDSCRRLLEERTPGYEKVIN